MLPRTDRGRDALAMLLLLLLPTALLGECLFGGKAYLPFDIAEYPPVATTLRPDEVAALREHCNYDATEAPVWFVPELALARAALLRGQYPHWDPYVRGGAPLAAHGHLGLLDPLHWPALLFADPADGLLYLTWIMFALAGLLMYGLLRALDLSPPAALFGAVAFALSGTMGANGHWFQRMEPLALLPGLLWAELELARAHGRRRALPAALLALGVALCWLAGFPPFCIPVTLLAGAAGVVLVAQTARRDGAQARALAAWLAGGMALGLLLAAPQILQQVAFFPLSNRPTDPTLASASRFALPPCALLGYVFPELFSHPGDAALPGDRSALAWLLSDLREWGTGARLLPNYNFTEYALFPGTLVLLFALLAPVLRGARWRWLAGAALVLLWLLATGACGAHLLFALPGVKAVPPYRFIGPACAFVAMLAACGFESLCRMAPRWPLRAAAVVLVAAGAYCLGESTHSVPERTTADDPWVVSITERYREAAAHRYGVAPEAITPQLALEQLFQHRDRATGEVVHDQVRLSRERLHGNLRRGGFALLLGAALLGFLSWRGRTLPGWPLAVCLVLTVAELFPCALALNRGRALRPHDSEVHAFLRHERDAAAGTGGFMIARGNGDLWQLPGGTLAPDGIRDLHFYTFVDGRSGEPIRRLYGDAFMLRDYMPSALPDDERLELPWWDLMGLRYVLSSRPMQHAGARVGPALAGPGGEFFVYERPRALPRAWVVPALRQVADDAAAVAAVLAQDLDPRAAAIVTEAEAALLGAPLLTAPAAGARQVEFAFTGERRILLRVGAGPAGYLVVADTHLPGWSATIGGQEVPIARGNVYQRVVALPVGACEVEFRYFTPGLVPGLLLGALAAAACALLLVVGLRARARRRARPRPPEAHAPEPGPAPQA